MNGKNKRWLEQRWDKRQPERLEHIKNKQALKGSKKKGKNYETHESKNHVY